MKCEEKPGAAGSGLSDLVGGIFPPSQQHTETPWQGLQGSVSLQVLLF